MCIYLILYTYKFVRTYSFQTNLCVHIRLKLARLYCAIPIYNIYDIYTYTRVYIYLILYTYKYVRSYSCMCVHIYTYATTCLPLSCNDYKHDKYIHMCAVCICAQIAYIHLCMYIFTFICICKNECIQIYIRILI